MFATTYDESFREVAQDLGAARAYVQTLEAEEERVRELLRDSPEPLLEHDLAKIEMRLADAYRLTGASQTSVEYYDRVIAFHRERPKPAYLHKLKRALALSEFCEGDPFEELEPSIIDFPVYEQFFLEYRARVRFRLGAFEACIDDLERALALRTEIGNAKQITHTERWIFEAKKRQ